MKIAILSNVNVNGIVRLIQNSCDIYENEGYGNEIGMLLNEESSLCLFKPDIIFLIEDLQEITGHSLDKSVAFDNIEKWFAGIKSAIRKEIVYYISDSYAYGDELEVLTDSTVKDGLEHFWCEQLRKLILECPNVRMFPYRKLVEQIGAPLAFSKKMWYMGKILHSAQMQQLIADMILEKTALENRIPKKVLLLDLDNTLWGGLAGENDISPIELSEEHKGLAYKNLQRTILQMKNQGVILGIVSKNNYQDAMNIIDNHPHMVLHEDDFAIKKINWNTKTDNIVEIAKELNVGLDSMVFWDDNPTERELVGNLLPEVEVPEFPKKPELLADSMIQIWKKYFEQAVVTKEDSEKTEKYRANLKRDELLTSSVSFEDFLKGLEISLLRVDSFKNVERITQLINKTNQFNLTTQRHSQNEIQQMLEDDGYRIFAYRESDKFGDNGIISVVILNLKGEIPVIEEMVMSCRVMGKKIENAIIDDIEKTVKDMGYSALIGKFIQSVKNAPVKNLYTGLGYSEINDESQEKKYIINLNEKENRDYCLKMIFEEN